MGYSFNIRFKPTRLHTNADALSRLPAGPDVSFMDKETLQINYIREHPSYIPRPWMSARRILLNWNPHWETNYFGCRTRSLLRDAQVVIPKQLRSRVLHVLHRAHPRVEKISSWLVFTPNTSTGIPPAKMLVRLKPELSKKIPKKRQVRHLTTSLGHGSTTEQTAQMETWTN